MKFFITLGFLGDISTTNIWKIQFIYLFPGDNITI
jgi:hypothetical protein